MDESFLTGPLTDFLVGDWGWFVAGAGISAGAETCVEIISVDAFWLALVFWLLLFDREQPLVPNDESVIISKAVTIAIDALPRGAICRVTVAACSFEYVSYCLKLFTLHLRCLRSHRIHSQM